MVALEVQLDHALGPESGFGARSWVVADLLRDCRPPLEAWLPDVGPSSCGEELSWTLRWDLMGFEPAVIFVPFSLPLFLFGCVVPWSLLGVAVVVPVAVEPPEPLTLAEPPQSER